MIKIIQIILLLLISGCVQIPDGIVPIDNFSVNKYLGKWYEIARLDHSFERGLSRVTAEYSLNSDGGVKVLNRGYSEPEQTWHEAEGRAYFVNSPTQGFLQVSFFWPIYGAYIIFVLDHKDYQYSLVSGPNRSYLWLLARQPKINDDLKQFLIMQAQQRGFDTSKLIFVTP